MAGPDDRLRHLLLAGTAQVREYTYPKPVRGKPLPTPVRDRRSHAHRLLADLAAVRAQLPALKAQRDAVGVRGERGVYLEFTADAGFELALERLERRDQSKERRHIEVVAVPSEAERSRATVFVPEGRLTAFENLVRAYATQGSDEKPKNKELVDSITSIRAATLQALWTDDPDVYPAEGEAIEWEVWLRQSEAGGEEHFLDFSRHAEHHGLRVAHERLVFPDRVVCRAHGTAEQMAASAGLLDCVAELRKAKEPATFFLQEGPAGQHAWVSSYVSGLVGAPGDAPAVCVLDSGVTSAHPLLARSITDASLHSYDPRWGVGDAACWGGHGTAMASLAIHGDLVDALPEVSARQLEHCLESVKILPPADFAANPEPLFGAITAQAASLAEIAAPERRRVFCLAVTAKDARDRGEASSWSAKIDDLAFGLDDDHQRLFVVSAGNIDEPADWRGYPHSNDAEPIRDPAQAWNALTVGAMTEKLTFDSAKYPGWAPVAPHGGLSHSSRTSLAGVKPCPPKPDLVMEGGNAARDPAGDVDPIDELAVLSAHFRPIERLLAPCGDTSTATAQVARLGAILQARYPGYWPETIRALLVHSAEWTTHMKAPVAHGGSKHGYRTIMRRYGWGVPDLHRASWSASNALTLVVQETMQPYGMPVDGRVPDRPRPTPRAAA